MKIFTVFGTRVMSIDEAEFRTLKALLGAYEGKWLHLVSESFREDCSNLLELIYKETEE